MDGGRPWRRRRMDPPPPLSRYGFDYFPGTNLPMYGSYYDSPPNDDHPYRTGRYTAEVLVPGDDDDSDSSNKRASRVADDDATLRRQLLVVSPASSAADCAICLQDLVVADPEDEKATPRAMPCSHAFHERCIFQWVRKNRDCPLCRRTLPTPEQQEYSYDDDDRLQMTMPVPRDMLEIEVL